MHQLTLHLTESEYLELLALSRDSGLTADAYVKKALFHTDFGVFTPKEAVKRAINRYEIGQRFELRDLYSETESRLLSRGQKIAFGKQFYAYTAYLEPGCVALVKGTGCNGIRALYELIYK